MAKTAILKVDIISDARKANAGFDQASSKVSSFEKGLAGANRAASVAGAGMLALGGLAIKAASEAQQAAGAVESVFKGNASQVTKFAENAAQAVGLSESAYSNFAARIGSQFKNLGTPMDQLAGKTNDLITKAADLAATFGGTTADAVDALSAAFRGEFDPIERYGISIRKSDVNARLAAKGLDKLEGSALKAAEAAEITAMLNEQSADALGQFGREADTAAGQQQRLTAEWENAKAELGEALLPVVTDLAEYLADGARWVSEHKDAVKKWAVALGTAVVVIKGISGAIKTYKAISKGVKTLKALFGLGQTAAMAGQAAGVATAHGTAATATSAAWATAGTASTTAVGAFAIAAGIEALAISAALILAAVVSAAAWGERSDEMIEDIEGVTEAATTAADTIREGWGDLFTGAASALSWAAWNARILGDTLTAQEPVAAAWGAAIVAAATSAGVAVSTLAQAFTDANNAAMLFGMNGSLALALIAAGLGSVVAVGWPVIAMLTAASNASQAWANVFAVVVGAITGGLGAVIGFIGRVIGAVNSALGPMGSLGNVGALAGSAISGAMSAAAGMVNAVAGAARVAIGVLQQVVSWARNAASAKSFFDGGFLGGAIDPAATGNAAPGARFLPPDAVFAASARGYLGALGAPSAGGARTIDARTFVTVEGALDPVAVADQIRRIIGDTDRTRGMVPAMRLGR